MWSEDSPQCEDLFQPLPLSRPLSCDSASSRALDLGLLPPEPQDCGLRVPAWCYVLSTTDAMLLHPDPSPHFINEGGLFPGSSAGPVHLY